MASSRRRPVLSRVVEFKPGEAAVCSFFFLYFFLITAPYYVIKPIRNASYLDQLGDERLPLAYFLTAVLIGFIVSFHSRLQIRLSRRTLIVSSLLFFFLSICLFWWLFLQEWSWVPVVFWVWANIFAIVLVTQFWMLVNDVFNPREAKRLIGFIGSGGQLGAILGSLLVGALARTRAFSVLLLIAAAVLALAILAVLRIFNWQKKRQLAEEKEDTTKKERARTTDKVGFRDALETTRKSVYLRLLAGIMLTTLIVSTLIDWQFNSVVDKRVAGGSSLASFFGYFNAGTMAFAFLFQLLLTSQIIRRFGIRMTLLFYPLILLFCSAGIGIIAYASIVPAILIKANDKSLAYSLNQSVRELLYIPISPEQKYKSKIFIDMFVNRFAKGLGAVILWLLLASFPKTTAIRAVSLAVIGIIAIWTYLNLRGSREYANLVKEKLELKWERGDKLVAEKMDIDFTRLVFDTVESKNRSSVLYAMHLFDMIQQDRLTPEVKKLISYKADEVRAASLGTLFEQAEIGLGPASQEELSEDVLKKEVAEIMALDVYQSLMKTHIEKILEDKTEASTIARMEAAKAIGLMDPYAPAAEKLADLLEDDSIEVRRYAMESAGRLKRRENIPNLISKLKNPVLREDASNALVKFGPKITGTLTDYLADQAEILEVRRAVPGILARIGTQEAADFLSWELGGAESDLAAEIIDALDKIRTEDAHICFSQSMIKARIFTEVKSLCQNFLGALEEEAGGEKKDAGLHEKRRAELTWNIFKLLGLIYPQQDMVKAYQNLKTGTKDSVAYALELLDNVLEKDVRDAIFAVVEDVPAEERIRRCRALLDTLSGGRRKE
ncbi:MAG: Npt1/Npt2 family nucleotide transporter [Clostridiales bacterium]|nr:Npt1/Npt2 family nucleotide transporter [Clostridiales bacterium]